MATELSTSTGGVARLRDVYKRTRSLRLPWLSLSIIAILLACAAFAPLLAPHEPDYIRVLDAKLAPGEDWSYPLGTDVLGRDMLSRLIYGARTHFSLAWWHWARGPFWALCWALYPATGAAGSTP